MECPICYDAIDESTGHTKLSCGHSYHLRCIVEWFSNQRPEPASCALCRHAVSGKDALPDCLVADSKSESESESDSESEPDEPFVALDRNQLNVFLHSIGRTPIHDEEWTALNPPRDGIIEFIREDFDSCIIWLGLDRLTDAQWQALLVSNADPSDRGRAVIEVNAIERERAIDSISELSMAGITKPLQITWQRIGHTKWQRKVNSDGEEAEVWNGSGEADPPDSLVIETTYFATKLQALWRGFRVRAL